MTKAFICDGCKRVAEPELILDTIFAMHQKHLCGPCTKRMWKMFQELTESAEQESK